MSNPKNVGSVPDPIIDNDVGGTVKRVRTPAHHIPIILSDKEAKENSFHAKVCAEGFQSTPSRGGRRHFSLTASDSPSRPQGIRTFK
jgi:hypothetical protein